MRFLCLPGDGIGPEIMAATECVVAAVSGRFGLDLTLDRQEIGLSALKTVGTTNPDSVIAAARAAEGVVLGPVSHNSYPPVSEGGRNPSGVLRRELDLYANIRPARSRAGLAHPIIRPVDLVIVRESLEGFYADRNMTLGSGEFMVEPGVALALRKITARASRRIAEPAFAQANHRTERKFAAIHKANAMRLSDGVFLSESRDVAAPTPGPLTMAAQ